MIVKQLSAGDEHDLTIQRALILSLGEFGEKDLAPDIRSSLVPKLQETYRNANDPGLHAAAEWLLRQWKKEEWLHQVDLQLAEAKVEREKRIEGIRRESKKGSGLIAFPRTQPGWYVNSQRQTMVVIPGPVEFLMGSAPTDENRQPHKQQHKKAIPRTFAIAAKPVTIKEFQLSEIPHDYLLPQYAPTPDCPVVGTSWHQAAAYCNWLSKKEGIPPSQWCYEMDPQNPHKVLKLKGKYLSLTGYRLPTETESEFAIRAGTLTSHCYGESEELLGKYAWFLQNSRERSWPVGSKKPNDLGLFDMHGNVWCWCQDSYGFYPQSEKGDAIQDSEQDLFVKDRKKDTRVLRGGSFYVTGSVIRSDHRIGFDPDSHINNYGFRPARTLVAY